MPNARIFLDPLNAVRKKYDDFICVSMASLSGEDSSISVIVEPNFSRDRLTDMMSLLQSELEGIIDEKGNRFDSAIVQYSFNIQRNHRARNFEYVHYGDTIHLNDVDNAHEIMISIISSVCNQVLKVLRLTSKRINFNDMFGVVVEHRDTSSKFFSVLADNFSHIYVDPPKLSMRDFCCTEKPNKMRVDGVYYAIDMVISCSNRHGLSKDISFDVSRGNVKLDNDLYELILNFDAEKADIDQINALYAVGYLLQFTSIMYSTVTSYIG